MPWQQHVADVAFEIDPETGMLAYREVRLTVPRQSGKTTLLLAVAIHRCLAFPEAQNVIYTAQNGVAARSKFIDDYLRVMERSAFASMFKPRLTSGHEALRWTNGSRFGVSASTEKSGHGQVLDLGILDEAFAHVDARLEQAFRPAMNTREQPQLWIVSTAGTPEGSVYLLDKVTDGRERVSRGDTSSVAYFEWSVADDADYRSEETWRACMPALGRTTPLEAIQAAADQMSEPEFRRAYLNQWVTRAADDLALPVEQWNTLADRRSRALDPVAFAVDVSPDRSSASVASFGLREDGLGHVEVIDNRPGTDWVVPRIAELVDRWQPCAVAVESRGPAASLIADFQAAQIDVQLIAAGDMAAACGAFFDAVANGRLRHVDQVTLNTAVHGAKRRPMGDQWAYGRRSSSVDISPLVAATLARYVHSDLGGDPGVWFM